MTARGLKKNYRKGPVEVPVLRGVSLSVRQGEFLAVVGQSGCGKTTLLTCWANSTCPKKAKSTSRGGGSTIDLRTSAMGWQSPLRHDFPVLSSSAGDDDAGERLGALDDHPWHLGLLASAAAVPALAAEFLDMVAWVIASSIVPCVLSGGETQRVAIARSLIARPSLLLADEPTGNLDQENGREIIKILRGLNQQQSLTIVMVTHDPAIAAAADRTVRLVDGRVAA